MIFSNRTVLVDDEGLSESEFIQRELELDFKLVNPLYATPGPRNIVASTDPSCWIRFLSKASENSIIFILLGNETYDETKYLIFNQFKSIQRVYVYNPPRKNSLLGIKSAISLFYDFSFSVNPAIIYRLYKNAFDFSRRTRRIKSRMTFDWKAFPQGYSNRFVKELENARYLKLGTKSSIFNLDTAIPTLSKAFICFVGQRGSVFRSMLLTKLEKNKIFRIFVTEEWGGLNQGNRTRYIDEITQSRGVLNPPGNVTNETFRYYETILLGRLPICPPYSIQDHHFGNYWSLKSGPWVAKWSYLKLAEWLLRLSERDYLEILENEREKLRFEVDEISTFINEFIQSDTEPTNLNL